jgi:hypothetical protein
MGLGKPPTAHFHALDDTGVPFFGSTLPCAAALAFGNLCEYHCTSREAMTCTV